MAQLCILLEEPLSFARLDNASIEAISSISIRGKEYKKRTVPDDDPVFYDWIIDETEVVRGLEIHLPANHSLLQSSVPLNRISLIEIDGFLRIWFGDTRTGVPRAKRRSATYSFWEPIATS